MSDLIKVIGVLCALPFLLLAFSSVEAFVLYKLWGWFVTPLGVAAVGFWQALGLAAIPNIILAPLAKTEEGSFGTTVATRLMGAAVFLALGWFAHLMMVS